MRIRTLANPFFAYPLRHPAPPFTLPVDAWLRTNGLHAFETRWQEFKPKPAFAQDRSEWLRSIHLLLCAGILMSPATSAGDYRAWGFFLEFAPALAQRDGYLRVGSDYEGWDSRHKSHFSEGIGLGMTGWLLWQRLDVVHIADAGHFIGKALSDPQNPFHGVSLVRKKVFGKKGELKPDLLCLTRTNEAVLAEVKGAIGTPGAIPKSTRARGKSQVNAVCPKGIDLAKGSGRLVFSANILPEDNASRSRSETGSAIIDPPGDEAPLEIDPTAEEIARRSYAKFLNFCGRPDLAYLIIRGVAPLLAMDLLQDFSVQTPIGRALVLSEAGGWYFGLTLDVAKVLFIEPPSEHWFATLTRAIPRPPQTLEGGPRATPPGTVLLPNGVVAWEALATQEE